jgi:hypothetical protein
MARRAFVEPGERDRDVRIDQRSGTTDAKQRSGYPVEAAAWSTLAARVPMKKVDVSARERFTENQVAAAYDTVWEMEYRADMDPELVDIPKTRRLFYEGRVHDVVDASQIGRREGIELVTLASTKVPA